MHNLESIVERMVIIVIAPPLFLFISKLKDLHEVPPHRQYCNVLCNFLPQQSFYISISTSDLKQDELKTTFDHLIFGSYFLEDGVNFIHERLGVRPEQGGEHLTMGTHNKLINLGNSTYLEVIAINPDLPKPQRPRWFGMDNLQPDSKPGLLTWVVRTNDIQQAVSNSKLQHGKIESLQRGIYQWQIAIPEDGQMPLKGITPTIIQWQCEVHPAQMLPPSDVTLISIEAFHPKADELSTLMNAIGFNGRFTATKIATSDDKKLQVTLKCPKGIVTFESSYKV